MQSLKLTLTKGIFMTKISAIIVLLAATSVFAAEPTTTTTTTTTTATTTPTTPKETCEALVSAAQTKNFETFAKLSLMGRPGMKHEMMAGHEANMKKGFEKMHGEEIEKLKGLTCGTEHVADTRAFVESESEGKTRFVPFVKEGNTWKFDTHTYMSFYEPGMMMGMGKKAGKMKK
jgi:hypothetical protein